MVDERIGAYTLPRSPLESGEFICLRSRDGNVGPRIHTRMSIVGVRSGSAVRVESRRTIVVENDCLLFVPPLHLYGLQALHGSGSSVVAILCEIPELEAGVVDRLPALLSVPSLNEAWTGFAADDELTIRIDRALALRALVEHWVEQSTPLPLAHAPGWGVPLDPLRDYMRLHVSEPIPTSVLVEMSGLTASHCIRAFSHRFGLPPHAYHVQLRLAVACELLIQGARVSRAAYDCGFADQSHLSRIFRAAYDLGPAAWAASIRKTATTKGGARVDFQRPACDQPGGESVHTR